MIQPSSSRYATLFVAVLAPLFASGCACDSSEDQSSSGGGGGNAAGGGAGGSGNGGAGGSGAGAGTDGGAGASACVPNLTEKCGSCSELGSRRCAPDGSGWSSCDCTSYGAEVAVSPSGDDAAAGTLAAPFKTLERAREKVQELVLAGLPAGGVVVWLRDGVYALTDTLTLGAAESGSQGKPVVWRGYPGETARFVGGVSVSPSEFKPISTSSAIYSRLDPAAQGKVLEVSLPTLGITNYGALSRRGFCGAASKGPLEIFVGGAPMTLARWPDATENTVPTNLEQASAVDLFGAPSPDVSGHYVKNGVQDGVSAFARQGLVGGLQYQLYRYSWNYQSQDFTAWFLTTGTTGYPADTNPWWYLYNQELGTMSPSAGASGKVSIHNPDEINHGFASIRESVSDTVWRYSGDRPSRWADLSSVWFHGFWKHAWADCHVAAASIDLGSKTVTLAESPGYGATANQPYYAYNMPEEITLPGEYWLDRSTGSLYLWPPNNFSSAEVVVSLLESPLVQLSSASFVELRDFTLEAGRSQLVRVDGGDHNQLVGLTLRNAGTDAGSISGTEQLVRSCNVHGVGNGGVLLSGGDRASLTQGKNTVENSHFHQLSRWEWTYRPAVSLSGDGNAARNNSIHDLPHSAILFGGNEHQIERNHIHHVCQFSSDAGAIYAGRDWGARGNVVRHNFVHDLSTWFEGYGVQGIYLDDCLSGIRVEGNVLYNISGYGIQHGGGRDNIMLNNIVAKSGGALTADSRCFDQANVPNNTPGDSWNLLEKLNAVGYQKEPWASRWPECAAIPNDWAALSSPPSHWLKPEGSELSRNVGYANGKWANASPGTLASYAKNADNLEDTDPLFVDEAKLDLNLKPNSPVFSIPGFEKIPFDTIGIQP